MKYIVIKTHADSFDEELFVFSPLMNHSDMAAILRKSYPGLVVVSAGKLSNYRETFESKSGNEFPVDQIRLTGDSFTLKVKSRPEDTDLFLRLSSGY